MNKREAAEPSFAEVIEGLAPALRVYLQRMVGDSMTADDLFQETSIKIARGLPGFEGRSKVRTWAFRIAHRVCLDHFRKSGRERDFVEFLEEEHAATQPEQDGAIVIDEMNECVRGVIDSLPPDYRTAIVLHDLQGLTAEETAQVGECTLATAKIRIHRARKRLRAALRDQCQFYRDQDQVFRCERKEGDSHE